MRIVVLSIAALLLLAGPSSAAPPPKPSQLVTLVAQSGVVTDCPDGGLGFAQQGADGNFSPFTIPNKQVLVVTSFEWNTGVVTANRIETAMISSQATGSESLILARSTLVADSAGTVGGTHVIPSGVAVSAGRTVCLQVEGIAFGVLHGYLTKAK